MNLNEAVQAIADGEYGLWSTSAKIAVKYGQQELFKKEFMEQIDDSRSRGAMESTFPSEIIKAISSHGK